MGYRVPERGMCRGRADVALSVACNVWDEVVGEGAECSMVLRVVIFVVERQRSVSENTPILDVSGALP